MQQQRFKYRRCFDTSSTADDILDFTERNPFGEGRLLMFGTYFYNESMRRMTIAFGQIFNNIQIKIKDDTGSVIQTIRVLYHMVKRKVFS